MEISELIRGAIESFCPPAAAARAKYIQKQAEPRSRGGKRRNAIGVRITVSLSHEINTANGAHNKCGRRVCELCNEHLAISPTELTSDTETATESPELDRFTLDIIYFVRDRMLLLGDSALRLSACRRNINKNTKREPIWRNCSETTEIRRGDEMKINCLRAHGACIHKCTRTAAIGIARLRMLSARAADPPKFRQRNYCTSAVSRRIYINTFALNLEPVAVLFGARAQLASPLSMLALSLYLSISVAAARSPHRSRRLHFIFATFPSRRRSIQPNLVFRRNLLFRAEKTRAQPRHHVFRAPNLCAKRKECDGNKVKRRRKHGKSEFEMIKYELLQLRNRTRRPSVYNVRNGRARTGCERRTKIVFLLLRSYGFLGRVNLK